MFRDWDWKMDSFLLGCKEFVAVTFYLLCYARMGNYDFFNGALILFFTMTVFSFPFLNSNLFTCLRLGPWRSRFDQPSGLSVIGSLAQILWMAIFQFAGAVAAAGAWHGILNRWGMLAKGVSNGMLYTNSTVSGAVYNSIDGRVVADLNSGAAIFFDELVAQWAFMVGVIHLMDAVLPDFLISAAYQQKRQSSLPGQLASGHIPVPLHFILFVCLLVAGVTRAFPSAHQSPQMSVYLLMLGALGTPGIDVPSCILRLIAGMLAIGFALVTYWALYGGVPVRTVLGGSKQTATAPAFMTSLLVTPFKPQAYVLMRDRN
jgi:hypothetical protein